MSDAPPNVTVDNGGQQNSTGEHNNDGQLATRELFWRDHCDWLRECGYILRRRYQPDWIPSWQGTNEWYRDFEDGIRMQIHPVMDAIRHSDGAAVAIKWVSRKTHPHEVEISLFFSTEPLASDPRNRCVPFYEVLQVPDDPDACLLVMPQLRPYNDPLFDTVGEAIEYLRQVFEGLQFMHAHHVAHRDCTGTNIMMNAWPLYPESYHPQRISQKLDLSGRAEHSARTAHPVKYYLIDFGLARKYDTTRGPPREFPIWGGDKTVPEFHRSDDACDPFPTDVYYLGNMARQDFLQIFRNMEFMRSLVNDMVQDDPERRPTMDQVVTIFAGLSSKLGYWKLRSRLVRRDEHWIMWILRTARHIYQTVGYIITSRPPMPAA